MESIRLVKLVQYFLHYFIHQRLNVGLLILTFAPNWGLKNLLHCKDKNSGKGVLPLNTKTTVLSLRPGPYENSISTVNINKHSLSENKSLFYQ
jgi:hypothetical protein